MNDVSWCDGDWSRGMVQRLVSPRGKGTRAKEASVPYTRMSAQALLERRGIKASQSERAAREPAAVRLDLAKAESDTVPGISRSKHRRPQSEVEEEVFPVLNPEEVESLESLLEWTRLCAAARSAFLLDAQGFIVERVGEWGFELAEATGTQVLLALERLGKAELTVTTLRSLNVEFEDHWLTAVPLSAGHGELYTLCLVTDDVVSKERSKHLALTASEVVMRV